MLRLKNLIIIEKPISEVFAFVSDQCNNPKWNYFVLKVEKTNNLNGAGAEYMQTRKSDQQRFRIEEFSKNERCIIQTLIGEKPSVRRELLFAGDNMQTVIEDQIELKLPIPTFLAQLFASTPRKAVKQNLEKLKKLLEEGQVTLQDGRKMSYPHAS